VPSSLKLLPSWDETRSAAPGLILVVLPITVISELIYWLESDYVESVYHIPAPVISLMIAAVIAIVVTNLVNLPFRFVEGVQFSTRWLLKIGIVLYGLNFSYDLWLKPGSQWILAIGLITVAIPMLVGYFLGKLVGLDDHSSMLVSVGTGICGISAIVATHQAVKSDEESAGMALATILVFGTFILFLYPILEGLLSLSTNVYGIWTGATTLDLPQLVAAALQGGGSAALLPALWVKSIRIGLLAPAILILVMRFAKRDSVNQASGVSRYKSVLGSFPLFILAFFLVVLVNTVLPIPSSVVAPLATGKGIFLSLNLANVLLTTAIIGICFRVRKNVLSKSGWKILITGGLAWLVQSVLVLWLANNLPIPHV
jgi:uncharacterized integral membrane protein (TIGR00698 family)